MLNSILLSAAMLLAGPSVSAPVTNVNAQVIAAPMESSAQRMTTAIETYLIEVQAASHWNITVDEAWYRYNETGELRIVEIEENHHYLITYQEGILDVFVDESDF